MQGCAYPRDGMKVSQRTVYRFEVWIVCLRYPHRVACGLIQLVGQREIQFVYRSNIAHWQFEAVFAHTFIEQNGVLTVLSFG